jgi:hypothetical protein
MKRQRACFSWPCVLSSSTDAPLTTTVCVDAKAISTSSAGSTHCFDPKPKGGTSFSEPRSSDPNDDAIALCAGLHRLEYPRGPRLTAQGILSQNSSAKRAVRTRRCVLHLALRQANDSAKAVRDAANEVPMRCSSACQEPPNPKRQWLISYVD